VEESLKDISVGGSNLSAVNQVEKLRENEDVENVSEHNLLGISFSESDAISSENWLLGLDGSTIDLFEESRSINFRSWERASSSISGVL
jgi:hypothetical protein